MSEQINQISKKNLKCNCVECRKLYETYLHDQENFNKAVDSVLALVFNKETGHYVINTTKHLFFIDLCKVYHELSSMNCPNCAFNLKTLKYRYENSFEIYLEATCDNCSYIWNLSVFK